MDNKSYEHLIITRATIDDNRKSYDYKMKTYNSNLEKLTEMIKNIMDQNQN